MGGRESASRTGHLTDCQHGAWSCERTRRQRDPPKRVTQVITMFDEVCGQLLEQRRMGCGVRVSKVVARLDQAPSHQRLPQSVDDGFGKVRVLGVGQPDGERFAAVRGTFKESLPRVFAERLARQSVGV